jgi:thymidylate kinase
VRQGYLQMVAAEPERWVVIEAAQPIDVAQQVIRAEVEAKLRPERAQEGECER